MAKLEPVPYRTPLVTNTDFIDSHWYRWLLALVKAVEDKNVPGYTGTITTAKLTGGGANGSITFENGIIVSQIAAT